jgi:uncharacterized membrane protein YeaQ/YmgE (transglycosylase-associated protein family)
LSFLPAPPIYAPTRREGAQDEDLRIMEGFAVTPGFGILATLIIGAVAGWLAEKITKSNHGLFTNILLGVAGSGVGVYILRHLGYFAMGGWIWTIVVATGGAVLLITLWNLLKGRS